MNKAFAFIGKRFLTCLILGLLVLPNSFSQTNLVTLDMVNESLESVINELKKQTDIDFIYNASEVAKNPKVTVRVSEGTVDDVLNKCLINSNLSYKKVENTIVIINKTAEPKSPGSSYMFKQNVRGVILDKDSKFPLEGAAVVVVDIEPRIGGISESDGTFRVEGIPVGRHTILVSYMGYEDLVLAELLIGTGKVLVLTLELTEKSSALEEYVFTGKKGQVLNEMAMVSANSFSVEETKRYAACISDPARMAQTYAGVAGGDDASNEIVIRGNSPNWMLWRLEGVEIPNPNHFAEEDYNSGAVSILSTNMLGKSDFYTGAFPAEYGNALSGVFDINLRKGNTEKNEYSAQLGVLGLELSAEGPFKKGSKASYLFNYRYSTLSILNNLNFEISENALPNYQDFSFKLHLPSENLGNFSVWAISGISDVSEQYLPDTTLGEKFYYGYEDYTKTGMYAAGISHMVLLNDQDYVKTVISSSFKYSSANYSLMDSFGKMNENFFDKLQNQSFRVSSFYHKKISKNMNFRFGLIANNLNYDYKQRFVNDDKLWEDLLNSSGETNLYQAYIQSKIRLAENLTATVGLHNSYFQLSKDNSLEPRFGLSYQMKNNQKLSFGYGKHSRHENLPTYLIQINDEEGGSSLPNKNLKLTRSQHFVLGYERVLGNDIACKIEGYYQHINKLPVPNNVAKYYSPIFGGAFPNDTLANIGFGRNYGIELTIQKYFTNDYYFLITSSLFDSKYKAADGIWRNTKYNLNYVNNFVAGKEFKWKENRLIGLNTKVIWTGGKRIIPLDLEASIKQDEAVYKSSELYTAKMDDYFRIDAGIKLHFFKEHSEHVLSLDVQNATNRLNPWFQMYDREQKSIVNYPMAGLIPILNYRIEF
jgi:hypothetical protein